MIERVSILGLGNVLMADDGFGPTVIHTLSASHEFEDRVTVEDLGTPGLNLIPYVVGVDGLIIVDTVSSKGAPGELRFYDETQLGGTVSPRTNPHDPGLEDALRAAAIMGGAPERVLVVGVIPGPVAKGTDLSPAMVSAVDPAIHAVLACLEDWGFAARPRTHPLQPDLWWREQATAEQPA